MELDLCPGAYKLNRTAFYLFSGRSITLTITINIRMQHIKRNSLSIAHKILFATGDNIMLVPEKSRSIDRPTIISAHLWACLEWSSAEALVVLEAVGVEPGHDPAAGHLAAQLVVADVELLQIGEIGHLIRDAPADAVVAQVQEIQLLRQLRAGEAELESVP